MKIKLVILIILCDFVLDMDCLQTGTLKKKYVIFEKEDTSRSFHYFAKCSRNALQCLFARKIFPNRKYFWICKSTSVIVCKLHQKWGNGGKALIKKYEESYWHMGLTDTNNGQSVCVICKIVLNNNSVVDQQPQHHYKRNHPELKDKLILPTG